MKARWELACGAIAGPLFALVFIAEGIMRPDYNSIRHPVSSLAFGETGWGQSANFIVAGILSFVFTIRLRAIYRTPNGTVWGPRLVALSALCLMATGLFLTDPFSGYPPGTPGHPLHYTTHGILHTAVSSASFLSLSAACLVFARHFFRAADRTWMLYSIASGLVTLFFFFCELQGMNQVEGFVEIGGLLQRVAITISMAWLTLLAVKLWRASERAART
jgi:hypothetical membrane protein